MSTLYLLRFFIFLKQTRTNWELHEQKSNQETGIVFMICSVLRIGGRLGSYSASLLAALWGAYLLTGEELRRFVFMCTAISVVSTLLDVGTQNFVLSRLVSAESRFFDNNALIDDKVSSAGTFELLRICLFIGLTLTAAALNMVFHFCSIQELLFIQSLSFVMSYRWETIWSCYHEDRLFWVDLITFSAAVLILRNLDVTAIIAAAFCFLPRSVSIILFFIKYSVYFRSILVSIVFGRTNLGAVAWNTLHKLVGLFHQYSLTLLSAALLNTHDLKVFFMSYRVASGCVAIQSIIVNSIFGRIRFLANNRLFLISLVLSISLGMVAGILVLLIDNTVRLTFPMSVVILCCFYVAATCSQYFFSFLQVMTKGKFEIMAKALFISYFMTISIIALPYSYDINLSPELFFITLIATEVMIVFWSKRLLKVGNGAS